MKIYKLFSGFIAAVVIALGAGLYANENTSVGEELVVEETARIEAWFVYTGSMGSGYDPHDPLNYELFDHPTLLEPNCDQGTVICAVKTEVDIINNIERPASKDLVDMASDIDNLVEGPSLKFQL